MSLFSPDAPCNWDLTQCSTDCGELENANTTVFANAKKAAISTVFRLTMSRFTGECEATIRPCKSNGSNCCLPFGGHYYDNSRYNSSIYSSSNWPGVVFSRGNTIYNADCYSDCDNCDCSGADCIVLPYYPVGSVEEVVIDGVVQPSSTYFLRDQKYLCKTDDSLWPVCQDLSKPLTDTGTWSVKFKWGIQPPDDLLFETANYACQLAKRCLKKPCDLPQKITVVEQQLILDPLLYIKDGKTGYGPLDALIYGINPTGALRPARLINPRKFRQSYSRVNP